MALETESSMATYASPSPTETPYWTPSLGMSRRSSRNGFSSPAISSSPPPVPSRGDSYFPENTEKDVSQDEKISILDPRRFTPTLHASLVSEILSLRREVESKNALVLSLEENLDVTKTENSQLNDTIASNSQENRGLKRQIELLEGGTLSALEEIAKDRDQAVENLAETRKRLETAQKKVRSQEEEATRAHSLWDGDKQQWESEKRNLDRKVHIAETRLKTVLAEVEAAQASKQQETSMDRQSEDSHRDGWSKRNNGLHMTGNNHRSDSAMSNYTFDGNDSRVVRFSHTLGVRGSMFNGVSLAEELDFGDDDEVDQEDSDIDTGTASPEALPEEQPRSLSVQSHRGSSKARKLLGLTVEEDERAPVEESKTPLKHKVPNDAHHIAHETKAASVRYTDTATQFSPPNSPKLEPQVVPDPVLPPKQTSPPAAKVGCMVSQACQTMEPPLSPPESPVSSEPRSSLVGPPTITVVMKIASTQTEDLDDQRFLRNATRDEDDHPQRFNVPTITIHPPGTSSPEPRTNVVLPPRTKSVSCQVSINPVALRSVSVQTEEIRIDKRPVKLPPHLLPSAISSKPPSPAPESKGNRDSFALPPPRRPAPKPREAPPVQPRNPQRIKVSEPIKDGYPGNNDNGPLDGRRDVDRRRPIRSESLFAGFDTISDDEPRMLNDADYSDDSLGNKEPIRKTLSKVQNSWKLIPQTLDSLDDRLESTIEAASATTIPEESGDNAVGESGLTDQSHIDPRFWRGKRSDNMAMSTNVSKQPNIRRAALIHSGAVAHAQRPLSPSASDTTSTYTKEPAPPFPVPTRASSRKPPISVSDGAQSPTPQSTSFFGAHSRREHGRQPSKKPVLRKIRSAAAASNPSHENQYEKRSRSPPPPTSSSSIPESPQLRPPPPLPVDAITSPRHQNEHATGHQHQSSTVTETTVDQTSVVDAIAQTMIGEWMWKYVRRRKSFGMPDSPAVEFESGRNGVDNGSANGVRHKRWVWLAPYERAVMWSSKQPTSGSALMGKNGRKLAIQSVLDVKDDTPMPKGAEPPVGRSILILTPQRALKFTATTRERHYVWLAALSFLSHSSLGVDDLASLPPVPPKEYHPPMPPQSNAVLRRNPIRDSIRVAKDKSRPEVAGGRRAHTNPTRGQPPGVINEYSGSFVNQIVEQAAEAPLVPRFHSRQRSNTGPRPMPPNSFRSFASTAKPSNHSLTAASSDTHVRSSTGDRAGSRRGMRDDGSNLSPAIEPKNFFDAVGTVRMEAFVDRTNGHGKERAETYNVPWNGYPRDGVYQPLPDVDRKPPRNSYRTRQGRKKDMSYWGAGPGGAVSGNEAVTRRDPFENF
ncbi:hypothetical protein MMC30_006000 [Trapelia coarctata]|nr:hypothetical protein [Trapelia coarctata]